MGVANLIEIGGNDDLSRTVRICNHNFQMVGKAIDKVTDGKMRVQREDIDEDIGSAMSGMKSYVDSLIDDMASTIDDMASKMEEKIEEASANIVARLTPQVGSVLCYIDDTDPNTVYDGTVWQRIEGRFLMASDGSHPAGSTGGKPTITLTIGNTPQHSHAYKDTVPGATSGNCTLTVSQIPAHTHGSKTLTGEINFTANIMTNGTAMHILGSDHSGIVSRKYNTDNRVTAATASQANNVKRYNVLTVNATHEHSSVGGSGSHNHSVSSSQSDKTTGAAGAASPTPVDIIPPYIAVNVWKRVA